MRLSHGLISLHTRQQDPAPGAAELLSLLAPILEIWRSPRPEGHPCWPKGHPGGQGLLYRAWWGLCPSSSSLRMEGDTDGQTEHWTDPQQGVMSIIPSPDP